MGRANGSRVRAPDLANRFNDQVRTIALDVTDPEQIHAAVETTRDAFGRLDVLVNNAGFGLVGAVEETTPDHGGLGAAGHGDRIPVNSRRWIEIQP